MFTTKRQLSIPIHSATVLKTFGRDSELFRPLFNKIYFVGILTNLNVTQPRPKHNPLRDCIDCGGFGGGDGS